MGQKVHPTGLRLSLTRDWSSVWFASKNDYLLMLAEDLKARDFLNKKLKNASIGKIIIERTKKNARVKIQTARAGIVIGKKGEDIEKLKESLAKILGVPASVDVEEIKRPELNPLLVAEGIARQLEGRKPFRRLMKRAMTSAMSVRDGALGIKIQCSGRLGGAEMARTEISREGRVPLHTLDAKINYATAEAQTTYGKIGIKVWIHLKDVSEFDQNLPSEVKKDEKKRRSVRGSSDKLSSRSETNKNSGYRGVATA